MVLREPLKVAFKRSQPCQALLAFPNQLSAAPGRKWQSQPLPARTIPPPLPPLLHLPLGLCDPCPPVQGPACDRARPCRALVKDVNNFLPMCEHPIQRPATAFTNLPPCFAQVSRWNRLGDLENRHPPLSEAWAPSPYARDSNAQAPPWGETHLSLPGCTRSCRRSSPLQSRLACSTVRQCSRRQEPAADPSSGSGVPGLPAALTCLPPCVLPPAALSVCPPGLQLHTAGPPGLSLNPKP